MNDKLKLISIAFIYGNNFHGLSDVIYKIDQTAANMPWTYVRKPGTRRYSDTAGEKLQLAINAVSNGTSLYGAAYTHGIPYGTLYNKVKHLHEKGVGCPTQIPLEVEKDILAFMNLSCK